MGIKVQRLGLEDFTPSGQARLQTLIVGQPDSGKTRLASYADRPIFISTERGTSAIADRSPYVIRVTTKREMFEGLEHLAGEFRKPDKLRRYNTLVLDTVDALARIVKDEYQTANPNDPNKYGVWNELEKTMNSYYTKMLKFDANVILLAHDEDKRVGDGDSATTENQVSLQGKSSDLILRDVDQCGYLEAYWRNAGDGDGMKIHRRLTFKKTKQKPYLKDKLNLSDEKDFFEIEFREGIWDSLFEPLQARIKALKPSEDIEEIPTLTEEEINPPSAFVVKPEDAPSGAVPAQPEAKLSYDAMDRPTLYTRARSLGLPVKGNTTKSDLLLMLKEHDAKAATPTEALAAAPPAPPAAPVAPAQAPAEVPAPADAILPTRKTASAAVAPPVEAPAAPEQPQPALEETEQGLVDLATGVIIEATGDEAVATITGTLGGVVVEEQSVPVVTGPDCGDCGAAIDQAADSTRLARLKFRDELCMSCWTQAKQDKRAPGLGVYHAKAS